MIRVYGLLSRAQISQYTETSLTKIASIADQLDKKDLIQKIKGVSSGGRSPNLLQVRDDLCYTLGIEIGTQHVRAIVMNVNGAVLGNAKVYEPLKERRTISIQDLQQLAYQALQRAHLSWNDIVGIGVGITGFVDENSGHCLFLPNAPDWRNLPIVERLQELTGSQHIFVTDSARGMALCEKRYGNCREMSDFIVIEVGVGLGAGIVIDNKILTGSRGIVGEFGHMYIGGTNEICVCGNYGCLESIASGWAIVRRAKEAIERGVVTSLHDYVATEKSIQISDILHAAKDGDKFAVNLLEETANYLSLGISMLINLLDPQVIVITGGLAAGAGELLMKPLINSVRAKTLPWLQQDIAIQQSQLGEYSAARGAATLAMDNTFKILFSEN
jgi:predicted NBD/HSP70 family sugar kinase